MFDLCSVGNSVISKLVLHLRPHILQQKELSLHTNNLSHWIICSMLKWMVPEVYSTADSVR
jgi:hypothetical protein